LNEDFLVAVKIRKNILKKNCDGERIQIMEGFGTAKMF